MADRTRMRRLLVVEDDSSLRTLQETRFRIDGFEVDCAVDGSQALQLLQMRVPDAIVTDLVMPNVDGAMLCRQVRGNPRTRHVPVVLYTSLSPNEATDALLELGGVYLVAKSTPWQGLRAVVRRSLDPAS